MFINFSKESSALIFRHVWFLRNSLCQSTDYDILEERILFSRRLHNLPHMFFPYCCTLHFAKHSRLQYFSVLAFCIEG